MEQEAEEQIEQVEQEIPPAVDYDLVLEELPVYEVPIIEGEFIVDTKIFNSILLC